MNIIDITPKQSKVERKIRLAPYCRVSSDSEDQRHSFATQIRYYSEYTQKHPEYELIDIYADEGITGTCINKRDEFKRMLKDCQNRKIDRVLVKSVQRFARNSPKHSLRVNSEVLWALQPLIPQLKAIIITIPLCH